jgi:hypothetical protein
MKAEEEEHTVMHFVLFSLPHPSFFFFFFFFWEFFFFSLIDIVEE